jgi:hypothetical protein
MSVNCNYKIQYLQKKFFEGNLAKKLQHMGNWASYWVNIHHYYHQEISIELIFVRKFEVIIGNMKGVLHKYRVIKYKDSCIELSSLEV